MARDTNGDVTHSDLMGKMSNKTKETSEKMLGSLKPPNSVGGSSNTLQLLKGIYKLMVKGKLEKDLHDELQRKYDKQEKDRTFTRHQEILKALAVRKPEPKPKKEKPAEKPVAKAPEKPIEKAKPQEAAKKPVAKAPEKPVEKAKPQEAVKKQVEKEADKAKQTAQKEADKARETAKKETDVAKKKIDEEAKRKAEESTKKKAEEEVKKSAEKVKKAEKKKVEPVKKEPAPTPKVEPVKPPISIAKPGVLAITGIAGVLASSLAEAGITERGQANILAQVKSESNFQPKSENLNYSSAKRIYEVFKPPRIPDEKFAQQFINNPEALANHVYAKTDGNSEPGDGWKYRGRGFVQHTGKNQYKAIKEYTGVDVVNNPDLLNDPKVAIKALAWFFLKYKKLKPQDLEDINKVNKAVGFADKKDKSGVLESEKRKKEAEEFLKFSTASVVPPSSGNQVEESSQENANLKSEAEKQKQQRNVNNTNVNVQQSNNQNVAQNRVDDTPAIIKKGRV